MKRMLIPLVAALLVLEGATAHGDRHTPDVVVNGTPLAAGTIRALEQHYGARVLSGRYWYDDISGLWGLEGGPAAGRMDPGLRLGGRLRASASQSDTGVFINGREIHWQELRFLQQCFGQVIPGRYWLNAQGIGGFDGGPARFDLTRCFAAGEGRGSLLSGYFLTGVSVIGGQ